MLIAISVTFPLFLIARERKPPTWTGAPLRPLDAVLLASSPPRRRPAIFTEWTEPGSVVDRVADDRQVSAGPSPRLAQPGAHDGDHLGRRPLR